MLVLTRRETERILFPTLGISVEVLRIRGNSTQLGIDAPADIPVLRHELADRRKLEFTPDDSDTRDKLRHLAQTVRQRLDSAATALNELHQILDDEADQLTQRIIMDLYGDLQALEMEANRTLEWSEAAKSLRVLIVEDNITERQLLAYVLELNGMQVTTAPDGQEALEFLSLHAAPDAILLDMLMPRCDGPSFVQQVRANPEHAGMKIYAVSGVSPGSLGMTMGEGGIDGWFPKPLEPGELISALDQQRKVQAFAESAPETPC